MSIEGIKSQTKSAISVSMAVGATAGIPHAAILANNMKLPMGYVRSSSKGHGRSNQIEGLLVKGANVVVVEDLISTGGSSIKVVETLRESGFNVLGVVAIFSYQLEAADKAFQSINLPYYSLSDYTSLLEVAVRENKIKESDLSKLRQWKKNPKDESWMSL
jgi:orotate phosphoribosyltransferase